MMDLLLRLEYRRLAWRGRVLARLAGADRACLGLAAIVFFVYLFVITPETLLLFPTAPVGPLVIPVPFVLLVGGLVLAGIASAVTVVLLPASLIFF